MLLKCEKHNNYHQTPFFISLYSPCYRYGFNTQEKESEISEGIYTAKFWKYDSRIGRRWELDPVVKEFESGYSVFACNPILYVDPKGDDWVQSSEGEYSWDKDANDEASTKDGFTYIGQTLKLEFNSYIDEELWDGPMGDMPCGDKLTSVVCITGEENADGELINIQTVRDVAIGWTPVGTGRDYYPGVGGSRNIFEKDVYVNNDGQLTSFNVEFEQHASVSRIEEFGLNALGYKIVDVAQKLDINYVNNKLSIDMYTDVFPSATLSVNSQQIAKYNQPSFVNTHTAPCIKNPFYVPGTAPYYRDFSYYPSVFYKRN